MFKSFSISCNPLFLGTVHQLCVVKNFVCHVWSTSHFAAELPTKRLVAFEQLLTVLAHLLEVLHRVYDYLVDGKHVVRSS